MAETRRLLPRVYDALRARHYSRRTEEAYVGWIKRFIFYNGKRHPSSMGGEEVNAFLTSLAVEDHVSAATQNQALCALLFLYREVLHDPLPWMDELIRARRPFRVPVVLTPEEVKRLLDQLTGTTRLIAVLLYGSGLRLLECLQLRVKDVNFARHEIFVRDTKGKRDRVTTLPRSAEEPLQEHLVKARALHERDLAAGAGYVRTPTALARKIPSAPREWLWQWVFPAKRRWRDERAGIEYRHHLHETVMQRAIRAAANGARFDKRVTCHTPTFLRHAPARARPGHQDGARAPRPPRRRDDDDLHPRPAPRRQRRAQPGRQSLVAYSSLDCRPKPREPRLAMLRTRVTLQPGRPGTKKLLAEYGSKLVCVRYRYDDERQTRCKTIELVIEEIPWPPPRPAKFAPSDMVSIRVNYSEETLRTAIKHRGGRWNALTKSWTLTYAAALALRLTDRIVPPPPPVPR